MPHQYYLPPPKWVESHETELAEKIAFGWGDTPPDQIPANWREVKGPDAPLGLCGKEADQEPQRCLNFMQRSRRDRANKLARERSARKKEAEAAGIVLPPYSRAGGFALPAAKRAMYRNCPSRMKPQCQVSGDLFEMGVSANGC